MSCWFFTFFEIFGGVGMTQLTTWPACCPPGSARQRRGSGGGARGACRTESATTFSLESSTRRWSSTRCVCIQKRWFFNRNWWFFPWKWWFFPWKWWFLPDTGAATYTARGALPAGALCTKYDGSCTVKWWILYWTWWWTWQIKSLKLGAIEPFLSKALEPPSPKAIQNAMDLLYTISAMDQATEELTPLGTNQPRF